MIYLFKEYFSIPKGCFNETLVLDGWCNDETNNAECNFDGGDCCGSCVNTKHCTDCSCIGNINSNRVSNALVRDGYCNDKMNKAECNFDGGDCCGHCETITVTLENNVQAAQGRREGIYHNSSMVNGMPSWTSTSQAIWYDQCWKIGYIHYKGSGPAGIESNYDVQCPFDQPSEEWHYYTSDNDWASAGANGIHVKCLNGNIL